MAEVPQLPHDDAFFHQILVNPGDNLWQVTFDDNKNQNVWSYHVGIIPPHITELFHIESAGSNSITIFGYLPPSQQRWYLTVFEDNFGVVEHSPKFRPESEVMDRKESLHQEFTIEFDITSGNFALSFKKNLDSETVYLVPAPNNLIVTHKTDVPDYVFKYQEVLKERLPKQHLKEKCQEKQPQ